MSTIEGYRATPDAYTDYRQAADNEEPFPSDAPAPEVAIPIDDRQVSLAGIAQYVREVRQLTPLSRADEASLVEQARNGDQAAKHRLIEDCLPYIIGIAKRYHVYAEHEDLLDIVGAASLAVTATLDKALTLHNPGSYLYGVAKREVRSYCFYHSRLIPIKDHRTPAAEVPTVVRLDECHVNIPYQAADAQESDRASETKRMHREQLCQALAHLTNRERQTIELHHGLQDGTCEDFTDIAKMQHVTYATAYRKYHLALQHLRELVAIDLGS
jgi:RNA polymerase sigma factor (sigma-70 family)